MSCAKHICIEQEIVVRGTKWERRVWRLSSSHAVSFVMLVCLGHFYHATGAIEPVFAIADAAVADVLPDIVVLSLVVFFASLNPGTLTSRWPSMKAIVNERSHCRRLHKWYAAHPRRRHEILGEACNSMQPQELWVR